MLSNLSPAQIANLNPDVVMSPPSPPQTVQDDSVPLDAVGDQAFTAAGIWGFNAAAFNPPPLTGMIRANNNKQNEATLLYISTRNDAGVDATSALQTVLKKNNKVRLQSNTTPSQDKLYIITGDFTLDTSSTPSYMRVPVVFESGDQDIANGVKITLSVGARGIGVRFSTFHRGESITAMCFGTFGKENALYIATGDRVYRMDPDGYIREMMCYPIANPLLPPAPAP